MGRTIESLLARIGLATAALGHCGDLDDEWSTIKRAYFKRALRVHPDKGGDAATFRKLQAAFDSLRSLYDRAKPGFLFSTSATSSADHADEGAPMDVPSWEYYAEAAQEVVPMYRVERAKSARARCQAKGSAKQCEADECIAKDELRVGWMNSETGTYGMWVHLKCWRVPNRVWLGLPDPNLCHDVRKFTAALKSMGAVLLSGLGELDASEMRSVASYCMSRNNWARKVSVTALVWATPSYGHHPRMVATPMYPPP